MKWKYVPFAGFLLFAAFVSVVRYILTPQFSFAVHVGWFIGQYLFLASIWIVIRLISRFLDKRLSYSKGFSRRVLFQIVISLVVTVPPVVFIYRMLRPRLPDFFSTQFVALAWILFVVIIVLMNTGMAAGAFFSNWQRSVEEKRRAEDEKRNIELELVQARQKQTEMEMRALRAQMNPHFIFNSLNSINKYILKSDHANASKYLTRFAKLIRLILDNSNSREVALSDELDALKLYIEMESLRFADKFSYEIIVDENVPVDTLQVPPLIIQPYVENAIWHGLLHKGSNGKLSILVQETADQMLQCTIEDNGIGRARAKELKSKSATMNKSLGMKLTEERITMLNRNDSLNASIQIIDLENSSGEAAGTRVVLTIPI